MYKTKEPQIYLFCMLRTLYMTCRISFTVKHKTDELLQGPTVDQYCS